MNRSDEINMVRDRLYDVQSDYRHCDYVDSCGNKCGRDADNFIGGIRRERDGKLNSIMLCDTHKHLSRRPSMIKGILASLGIGILGVGVLFLMDRVGILQWNMGYPFIIYGGALFYFSCRGLRFRGI